MKIQNSALMPSFKAITKNAKKQFYNSKPSDAEKKEFKELVDEQKTNKNFHVHTYDDAYAVCERVYGLDEDGQEKIYYYHINSLVYNSPKMAAQAADEYEKLLAQKKYTRHYEGPVCYGLSKDGEPRKFALVNYNED